MDAPTHTSLSYQAGAMERGTSAPFFSIVVATRNRGDTIVATLDSLFADDYPAYEIIVVDQSTDDRTADAVRPLLNDDRLRYFRLASSGVSRARNFGIAHARGEWIAILDDDCVVPAGWLHRLAAASTVEPALGVVFGNVLPGVYDAEAGFIPAYVRESDYLARSVQEKTRVEGIAACMAVRRAAWRSLNGFDEELGVGASMKSGAETDFTIRALLADYTVYETPEWALTHHGFRTWEEGSYLIYRYWYGTGSAFAKLLKCGYGSVALLLIRLGGRWLFSRSRVAASLGSGAYRWERLVAFARGFARGGLTPVDRRTDHFRTAGPAESP